MRVRLLSLCLVAALALLFGGCGGSGNAVTVDETSDPFYQQAQDLKKQGRNGEALNAFLKVIDRRGENGAPESHLEAGTLYLNWSRDPVEAYHHFSKYLELQPVGPRSDIVRGQRDAAARDFVRMRVGPGVDQTPRITAGDDVEQLRRRIQELEAEIQTLRGTTAVPVMRTTTTPVISLNDDKAASEAASEAPATPAPAAEPAPSSGSPFLHGFQPPPAARPPTATTSARPSPATSAPASRTPTLNPAAGQGERYATAPTRPGVTQRPTAPAAAGRRHTVSPKDTLYGIARRYYGQPTQAQVQAIFESNRDIMRSPTDLRAGMVLRIP